MSWLGWGPATSPQFEELVEKYCSPLNLPYPQSEDIATALEVTDLIRSKAVQPKPAMQSLKRRIASKNGRVQMYAMALVDTCIKNGGDHFLAEIASREFIDEMSGIMQSPTVSAEVRNMAIKDFQTWALLLEPKPELRLISESYHALKGMAKVQFPTPTDQTGKALLDTRVPPAWVDSDVCMRCRTAFSFTNRKHHCRNCGQVFDQQCSSKLSEIEYYGITTPVRVCDTCHEKLQKKPPVIKARTRRTRQDLDADIQRAIELSLADGQPDGLRNMGSEPPLRRQGEGHVEDDDEELRMAIEASLRESEMERPSAPNGLDEPEYKPLPTFDLTPRETETVLTFSNTLDQMAAYGERDLRRFPYAHVLYEQAYAVGGKLQRNAEEKHTKQQMLAEMQDKLSQAVGLYGHILDGQQAYSARRAQEQQQRQYQHQQYMPPQQYQPYGYENRYAPPASQNGYTPYAQQQYQPPTAQAAGPSMYPTLPQGQPMFTPQIYQPPQQHQAPPQHSQYQQQPPQQHSQYQQQPPQQQAYGNSQYPQQPLASSPNDHSSLQRQHSLNAGQPQREVSMPYTQEPQGYSVQPHQTGESSYTATAPPPVDLASHPSTSPQSTTAGLPSAPPGLASPVHQNTHMPPIEQQYSAQHAPQQQAQAQPQQQYSAQPPQAQEQQQQHVYYDQSFPQAPAAVFPDAPSDEISNNPGHVEKEEPKEALLIEL